MTIEQYQALTGITVPASRTAFVTAQLERTRYLLEDMLGYTLDSDLVDDNQYTETGIRSDECASPDNDADLADPEAVVNAYRLFPYNEKDKYLLIDPASAIHAVKLVNGSVTYKIFESDEYRPHYERGIIKALEKIDDCWWRCACWCADRGFQLAVDAEWLWESDIPTDLQLLWADMTTYYSNAKKDVKSETLGPHSYTKYDRSEPQFESSAVAMVKRYSGPLGSVRRIPTL